MQKRRKVDRLANRLWDIAKKNKLLKGMNEEKEARSSRDNDTARNPTERGIAKSISDYINIVQSSLIFWPN